MHNGNRTEWFWETIRMANSDREKLKDVLWGFELDELISFQEEFVDFSIELQDQPYTDYMEESEDGIEDIANWVVSKGKAFYDEILRNPQSLPRSVNLLNCEILYGIADEVCYEKYGKSTGVY
ncbi:DUF4240 domain-containing protein [uncultured Brevibacillus sp.]|uniref:DUF4240 domain-containing protein n=1 Tax=uncultured Brevibacillus sp. TaxID=169970 RepID=UPI0025976109|nr:DUF4240 domain-containing protein [uncultured Brevibacillus sp.]